MFLGVFAMLSVMTTHGNTIGEFALYVLLAGFLFCCVQPRTGFFVWLVACGYNDLFKRLMVIGGRMSWNDLPYVLGITPMMFAGIVIACLMGGLTGSRPLRKMHWLMFALGVFMMVMNSALTYFATAHSVSSTMQALANDGLYYLLLFVVPVLFQDADDIVQVCRFAIWVFLPVAMYGIVQQVYGFQEFEVAYLKTGMSIEVKQLFTNRIRAFSTLNSPTALSAVCGVLAGMCLLFTFTPGDKNHKRLLNPFLGILLMLAYIGGVLSSASRSELIIIPVVPVVLWALLKPTRTAALYFAALMGFVFLVFTSAFILDNLDVISNSVSGGLDAASFQAGMVDVNTYSDRLFGFAHVLLNPKAWTWFGYGIKEGLGNEDRFHCHDPISATLIHYGALGLVVGTVICGLTLRWFHRLVFRMDDAYLRWLGSAMQALALGLALVSVVSGSILACFPINVFFCFFWGALLLLSQENEAVRPEPEATPEAEQEPVRHRPIPFWQKTTSHS